MARITVSTFDGIEWNSSNELNSIDIAFDLIKNNPGIAWRIIDIDNKILYVSDIKYVNRSRMIAHGTYNISIPFSNIFVGMPLTGIGHIINIVETGGYLTDTELRIAIDHYTRLFDLIKLHGDKYALFKLDVMSKIEMLQDFEINRHVAETSNGRRSGLPTKDVGSNPTTS